MARGICYTEYAQKLQPYFFEVYIFNMSKNCQFHKSQKHDRELHESLSFYSLGTKFSFIQKKKIATVPSEGGLASSYKQTEISSPGLRK